MTVKSDNGLIKRVLKKVNKAYNLKETLESLQAAKVYPGESVAIVISDFRKFSFSLRELT